MSVDVDFTARKIPELFIKEKRRNKDIRITLGVFTLGISELVILAANLIKERLLCRALLPAAFQSQQDRQQCSDLKNAFLMAHSNAEPATVRTKDGVELEAVAIFAKHETDKWIVKFCGNGENIGDGLEQDKELADDIGANIIVFNYRGVGNSKGRPRSGDDLAIDGSAIVEYLLRDKNVQEENILLYGYSLGGGVATKVCSAYPKTKLCNERSFSKGSLAIKHMMPNKFIGHLAAFAVKLFGTELNTVKYWREIDKSRKFIVFHQHDGIIDYAASLYKYLKDQLKKKHPEFRIVKANGAYGLKEEHKPKVVRICKTIEVNGMRQIAIDHHTFSIKEWDPNAHKEIIRRCRKLLGIAAAAA